MSDSVRPHRQQPPGYPVPGILQARTLEWVAISFSSAWKWKVKEVAQSCPTLSNLMDCSLPGSSVHGIFQAGVLEWGAIAFSISLVTGPQKAGNWTHTHTSLEKLTWVLCVLIQVCVSHSVVPNSLRPHQLQPARLLYPWDSPGKDTEWVAISISRRSSNAGIEPGSPALQADSLPSEPPGNPLCILEQHKKQGQQLQLN